MTYEQYWNGDVFLAHAYLEADRFRQERDNNSFWLQGLYIYEATYCAMRNYLSTKAADKVEYSQKPYDIFKKSPSEEERKKEAEAERLKAYAFFDAIVQQGKERKREQQEVFG